MKRVILTALVLLFTLTTQAQFYAGGSLGWWREGGTHHKHFSLLPEVGYQWSERLSFGAVAGFHKSHTEKIKEVVPAGENGTLTNSFEMQPYVRYNLLIAGPVNLFVEGTVALATSKTTGQKSVNSFRAGLRPGVSVALGKRFYATAHTGFLGYADSESGLYRDGIGFDFSGRELNFGLFYRF